MIFKQAHVKLILLSCSRFNGGQLSKMPTVNAIDNALRSVEIATWEVLTDIIDFHVNQIDRVICR